MTLYASTIFLSAFLLFQLQPMIAKMILPWFGGSAAVWITALLFFQTALLGGYLYAHWSIRSLKPKTQALVHALLLGASVLLLPILPSLDWKPSGGEDPIPRILGLLAVSIGLPYFLLSTTTPLIQAWYARKHKAALPYRLFALSNLASLLGLLAYPVLVEPNVLLRHQSWGWSVAYVVFVLLGLTASLVSQRSVGEDACPAPEAAPDTAGECRPPKRGEQVLWLLLAGCTSMLLLAVTNHLTQNVASIPFLWILPLGIYLLTFILIFDFERFYHSTVFTWLVILAFLGMAYGLGTWNSHTSLKLVIPSFSAGLFVCCMYFHGELAKRKPAPRFLTSFYLMLSLGGALGGMLVGIAAPLFLPGYFELPVALSLAAILMLALLRYRTWRFTLLFAWAAAMAMLLAAGYFYTSYRESSRVMARNFYGGLRVQEYGTGSDAEARMLVHGTVDHGMQFVAPSRRNEHVTYYSPESGVGRAIQHLRGSRLPLRVGIIGLGAGSLAAYALPGDVFRFYEINPLVVKLARDEFFYLEQCRGTVEVILGDGRLSLEREALQNYDLLAIDAFSGDAVPVHLLTRQALDLYFRHVKPDGILALHITNTHLALAPVVGRLAEVLGKRVVVITNDRDGVRKIYSSTWALMTSRPISGTEIWDEADEIELRPEVGVWTDDYNNLFKILK